MSATETIDWPTAFVAFSAVLGEPVEVADAAVADHHTPRSKALGAQLRSASREGRARAIAQVVTACLLALDSGGP